MNSNTLIIPVDDVMIHIADTIDTNKNVLKTDYYIPARNMNNLNLLAKSLEGFKEITVKVAIYEDILYKITFNNNHSIRVYNNSMIFDYNTKTFKDIASIDYNTEFFCNILVNINEKNEIDENNENLNKLHAKKLSEVLNVNALFIQYSKTGFFPYITQKSVKNNPNVYNGKKIKIKNIEKLNAERNIVAIIERDSAIENIIYYM